MDTINAKDASEIFRRPLSTIYAWAKAHGIARFEDRYGEMRFDVVALHLLAIDDRHGLRLYCAGLLSDDRLSSIKSEIGIGGSKIGLTANAFVPLAIEPSTRVATTLRAQLFADAEALKCSPLEVLIAAYAASMTARGLVPEAMK